MEGFLEVQDWEGRAVREGVSVDIGPEWAYLLDQHGGVGEHWEYLGDIRGLVTPVVQTLVRVVRNRHHRLSCLDSGERADDLEEAVCIGGPGDADLTAHVHVDHLVLDSYGSERQVAA